MFLGFWCRVEYLLSECTDINFKARKNKSTAFLIAISSAANILQMAKFLFERGANPSIRYRLRKTGDSGAAAMVLLVDSILSRANTYLSSFMSVVTIHGRKARVARAPSGGSSRRLHQPAPSPTSMSITHGQPPKWH